MREPLEIEILRQGVDAEFQHPHHYAANLIVAHSQHMARGICDTYQITLLRSAVDIGDCSGKHPGMASQQRFLLSFL